MLNKKFMSALAQLESVSCTQQERDTINAVRGKYVAKFGTENPFVRTLAKLESVAATQSEKDEINMIRGKFGLMEMQGTVSDIDTDAIKASMSTDAFDDEVAPENWDYVNNTPIDPAERKKQMSRSADMDWSNTVTPDLDAKFIANNRSVTDDPNLSMDNMGILNDYDETRSILGDPEQEDDY
jgi:hypothetical protein